jgi:hypothetical protein
VAEQSFNGIQVRALIKQVGSKGMTEGVNAASFGYAGFF